MRVLRGLWVWLVIPVVFVVYLLTLSPTVGMIDSGEEAAGCYLMNILHPTGYPLYTVLGRLATLVPLGRVVNRVTALSAVFATCGVALMLLLGLRLGVSRVVAGAGALLLGFSMPLWDVAVDVDAYSFTLALAVLLWLAAESVTSLKSEIDRNGSGQTERTPKSPHSDHLASGARSSAGGKPLLILAYLAGLTLTNHMTGASAVLGVALAVALTYRRALARRLPVLALLFLLGLSPYAFLVLRARAGPVLAWDNPIDISHFIRHVTGWQYQVWMFSGPIGQMMRRAGNGALLLARSLLYVLVPVVFYGAVRLLRQRRSLAIGLVVSAVLCFGYAINYSIPNIESYYLPCLAALVVFGMVGLDGLVSNVERRMSHRPTGAPEANVGRNGTRLSRTFVRQLPWVAGIAALALNFSAASKQGDYVAHDQAMNTLASAGPNAIIITDWWDIYAPAFYLQNVEHVRPDVCIIDKELVRRSWYLDYLARNYPWLVERSQAEIANFRPYLDEFEHGTLRDPVTLQRDYIRVLESFVTRNQDRPAYMTFDVDAGLDASQMLIGVPRAPVGLLFQIRTDSVLPEFDYTKLVIRVPPHEPDARTQDMLARYRYFVMRRADVLAASGHSAEVQPLFTWYESLPLAQVAPLPTQH